MKKPDAMWRRYMLVRAGDWPPAHKWPGNRGDQKTTHTALQTSQTISWATTIIPLKQSANWSETTSLGNPSFHRAAAYSLTLVHILLTRVHPQVVARAPGVQSRGVPHEHQLGHHEGIVALQASLQHWGNPQNNHEAGSE